MSTDYLRLVVLGGIAELQDRESNRQVFHVKGRGVKGPRHERLRGELCTENGLWEFGKLSLQIRGFVCVNRSVVKHYSHMGLVSFYFTILSSWHNRTDTNPLKH